MRPTPWDGREACCISADVWLFLLWLLNVRFLVLRYPVPTFDLLSVVIFCYFFKSRPVRVRETNRAFGGRRTQQAEQWRGHNKVLHDLALQTSLSSHHRDTRSADELLSDRRHANTPWLCPPRRRSHGRPRSARSSSTPRLVNISRRLCDRRPELVDDTFSHACVSCRAGNRVVYTTPKIK